MRHMLLPLHPCCVYSHILITRNGKFIFYLFIFYFRKQLTMLIGKTEEGLQDLCIYQEEKGMATFYYLYSITSTFMVYKPSSIGDKYDELMVSCLVMFQYVKLCEQKYSRLCIQCSFTSILFNPGRLSSKIGSCPRTWVGCLPTQVGALDHGQVVLRHVQLPSNMCSCPPTWVGCPPTWVVVL